MKKSIEISKFFFAKIIHNIQNTCHQCLSLFLMFFVSNYICHSFLTHNIQTMKLILPFFFILSVLCADRCSNQPDCFVKKLFDFSYPQQGIYNITLTSQAMNYQIQAYGDFNNDLQTDYLALNQNSILLFLFNRTSEIFELTQTITFQNGCTPLNFYLYDINSNGMLDATIWGQNGNSNCMYPLINNNGNLSVGLDQPKMFQLTTQPIIIQQQLSNTGRTTLLVLFQAQLNQRTLWYFNGGQYVSVNWTSLFVGGNVNVPFSNQHWNSFVDLTGDCFPDLVITNSQSIQFWIYNSASSTFSLSTLSNSPVFQQTFPLSSLNLADINYDGAIDLILANQSTLLAFYNLNPLDFQSQFCLSSSTNFNLNLQPTTMQLPLGCSLSPQNLQIIDIDIDGYPDIGLICSNGLSKSAQIYRNFIGQGGFFGEFGVYQSAVNQYVNNANLGIVSMSLMDILENGIVDFVFSFGLSSTIVLYNNYLYQNSFYIKAYGTDGSTTNNGASVVGMSFYYANSIGNSQRIAYLPQKIQTAYTACPMPYSMTGLGRANNYVQRFTVGRLGQAHSWSPIIPNSQLAIYTGSSSANNWNVRIFTMPADSLVYVIIVCIVVLAILGGILGCLSCRKKKSQEPLLPDV